ncbi:amino acid adenylation domain-containing protein, partial [Chryseobacterium sp. NRRL B-14859]|uniref:non-ribosomal peptide synthetase n=2 Tax=Chryseobacterium sp. NRRL B-14859 TaxID=1562763 RepID=UPI0033994651
MIKKEVYSILNFLKKNGASAYVEEGKLKILAAKEILNRELSEKISLHREEIISFLISNISYSHIPLAPFLEGYPLSSSQRRLWILSRFEGADGAYNIPEVFRVSGGVDIESLKQSYFTLLSRHEILRTVFRENLEGEVFQHILSDVFEDSFEYLMLDFSKEEGKISEIISFETNRIFDLSEGPLIRFTVLEDVSGSGYIFCLVMHHIISDGWSMDILKKELFTLYRGFKEDDPVVLPPLALQYKDYAFWEQSGLETNGLVSQAYWQAQLSGDLPVLNLPSKGVRPSVKTYNGEYIYGLVPSDILSNLHDLSRKTGCTLFMTVLSAVKVLLYRYSGQKDLIIGTPVAGRDHADLHDQIGFYVNTLALRSHIDGSSSFVDFLLQVREMTLSGYAHQSYPFDRLGDDLDVIRDMSRNPVFDVMVNFQDSGDAGEGLSVFSENSSFSSYTGSDYTISKFDLDFNFSENGSGLGIGLCYNTDLYDRSFADRLMKSLELLFISIRESSETIIDELNILPQEEHYLLTEGFNQTAAAYPEDKTVIDLFESQVLLSPENTALIFEGSALSYRELDERSNQFAHYLRGQYNIVREDLVGVQLERSSDFVITILGILKAGGAYVPIDPSYPIDRISYMKEDSGCKVVVDSEEFLLFKDQQQRYSVFPVEHRSHPNDLAYVIYTSGSTGRPKGVMVEHGGVLNMVLSQIREFGVVSSDVVFFFASIAFDASFSEVMMSLLSGSSLFICEDDVLKDKNKFVEILKSSGTSVITLPPAYSEMLSLEDLSGLRVLISAGESSSIEKGLSLCGSLSYFNAYGPTECSVCSSIYRLSEEDSWRRSIPIGFPISNTRMYILSDGGSLCPLGVVGEICISGVGVARGYLNNELLTSEKFVSNPYLPGERMYKTGDLGRWLSNGSIEYIGRKDSQVKIRGYRI